ncbi:MAG TPA: hypothetical protein P5567_01560 [Kiritimatiellia bacterium]|nr:hypothetical protein [Kiritimatiellia bacterium]HRZ11122.1 hypothetical protein [Kiritimatiellia bacterium]HSA19506.1 hypothetical protein [Kiritimatiellia bacterium]
MIVKMSKVTVLCVASAKDEALDALRDLGVLHVVPLKPLAGELLDEARARLQHVRRALEMLDPKAQGKPSGKTADDVVEGVWKLIHRIKEDEDALVQLRHEQQRLAPYGHFEPADLDRLREKGITVRLYQAPRSQAVVIPEGAVRVVLSEDKTNVYFAVSGPGDFQIDAQELKRPERSLKDVEEGLRWSEARLEESQRRLQEYSNDYAVVACTAAKAEETVDFLEARQGMEAGGPVAWLQGFCPEEHVPDVQAAAAKNGWGLLVGEPTADDKAPTLIRNPFWVKPIKAVFDFIGVLPGYEEIDISAVFLLFLSLFFAMLVGDAGYGLIFLGLTFWGRRKFPKAPGYPFHLLYIMSFGTVVWGLLTGSLFGMEALPAWLDRMTVAWLKEPKNVMLLCFLIGAVHLTIAHLWNISRAWNSLKSLAQLGWIGSTWTMFFMARNLVLGHELPGWIGWVFLVSVVLIVLFMTAPRDFKNEWFNHVMLPLNIVSNFVDVVSYIRLFAVGTAGYAVASSFNKMILGGGVHGIVAGLIAALLLFLGHTLNIILSAMGVLVHGVRLNTLEFSSHIGMAWTGVPYRPFRRIESTHKES